jgi:prevent-host-death family protein
MKKKSTTVRKAWSLAEAKARLSDVIRRAEREGPQTVTRHGQTAAIIVAAEDWKRHRRRKGTFVDFMNASPLRGSGIKIERIKDRPRDIDL